MREHTSEESRATQGKGRIRAKLRSNRYNVMTEGEKRGISSRLEVRIISVAQCIFYDANRPKQRFRRILTSFDQILDFQKFCVLSPVSAAYYPRQIPM